MTVKYVSSDALARMQRQNLNTHHRAIGCMRMLYTQPPRCPYTGWVEDLYSPRAFDPAEQYLRQRAQQRRNDLGFRVYKFIFVVGLALILGDAILRFVLK